MYNRANVLERLNTRLGTVAPVDLLTDLSMAAEDYISIETNMELIAFPTALESIVVQMVLELYNQRQSEGYQNETVEGVTLRYQDTFSKYVPTLRRYRKLRTL